MQHKTYPKQLKKVYKVETHDVDFQQKMKLTELMNLMQDLATEHADLLDFGYDFLLQKKQFWVLSRLRIEISSFPEWKQNIQCVTWSNGLEGIFPLRNWQFFLKNQCVISGYAQWLILDGNSHRPARPEAVDFEGKTHGSHGEHPPLRPAGCAQRPSALVAEARASPVRLRGCLRHPRPQ